MGRTKKPQLEEGYARWLTARNNVACANYEASLNLWEHRVNEIKEEQKKYLTKPPSCYNISEQRKPLVEDTRGITERGGENTDEFNQLKLF